MWWRRRARAFISIGRFGIIYILLLLCCFLHEILLVFFTFSILNHKQVERRKIRSQNYGYLVNRRRIVLSSLDTRAKLFKRYFLN